MQGQANMVIMSRVESSCYSLFQLRDPPVRIFLHFGEEGHTGTALVLAAVLHAALLYQL